MRLTVTVDCCKKSNLQWWCKLRGPSVVSGTLVLLFSFNANSTGPLRVSESLRVYITTRFYFLAEVREFFCA
jgi:hypothetical protein